MTCPICNREMILGKSVDKHHLIPKTFGGTDVILIHRICHQKIHSLFTERELEKEFFTIKALTEHPEMKKFASWVSKKPLEFYSKNKEKK